jgi:hypothetical protein
MASSTGRPRGTGGFSLDEAARTVRNSLSNLPALCPTCAAPLRRVVGDERGERVWLLRCPECGRGMVYRDPTPQRRRQPPTS